MDNNSKYLTKKALLILGNHKTGNTRLIYHMMNMHPKGEVFCAEINPIQLAMGVLPWGLIIGPYKLIVFEGITDIGHAVKIRNHINSIYSEQFKQPLPLIVFTTQVLKMEKIPFSIISDSFDVIEVSGGYGIHKS